MNNIITGHIDDYLHVNANDSRIYYYSIIKLEHYFGNNWRGIIQYEGITIMRNTLSFHAMGWQFFLSNNDAILSMINKIEVILKYKKRMELTDIVLM